MKQLHAVCVCSAFRNHWSAQVSLAHRRPLLRRGCSGAAGVTAVAPAAGATPYHRPVFLSAGGSVLGRLHGGHWRAVRATDSTVDDRFAVLPGRS